MSGFSYMPGRCSFCGVITTRSRRGTVRAHYVILAGVTKRCPGSFKEPSETWASWRATPSGDEAMAFGPKEMP